MSASNAGRIGVFGASGSGKSAYLKQKLKSARRVVVFDPMDEYARDMGLLRADTVQKVSAAMLENWCGFRIALVPRGGKEGAYLHQLCHLILGAQEGYRRGNRKLGMTLAVDEMNLAFPVHGGEARAPMFAEMCSRGRHYGVNIYGAGQRIAEVSTRFRGNLTETIILRQQGPNDRRAATDASGADPVHIAKLQNLEYLHCVAGKITPGKITF